MTPDPLDPSALDVLEQAAREATAGPWFAWSDSDEDSGEVTCQAPDSPDFLREVVIRHAPSRHKVRRNDVTYIAAADPPTVLALIARVRELEAGLARLERWAGRLDEDDAEVVWEIVGDALRRPD